MRLSDTKASCIHAPLSVFCIALSGTKYVPIRLRQCRTASCSKFGQIYGRASGLTGEVVSPSSSWPLHASACQAHQIFSCGSSEGGGPPVLGHGFSRDGTAAETLNKSDKERSKAVALGRVGFCRDQPRQGAKRDTAGRRCCTRTRTASFGRGSRWTGNDWKTKTRRTFGAKHCVVQYILRNCG